MTHAAHGFTVEPYTDHVKAWLGRTDHYIGKPPVGCLFAVSVRELTPGLFGAAPGGRMLGLCVIGRPIARRLPQDGSVGEVLRLWLSPGLPHGTASAILRYSADVAAARGMASLITYHDRTRHTGCIYRKAGFRKDGVTKPPTGDGWGSRDRAQAVTTQDAPKRRWRLDVAAHLAAGGGHRCGRTGCMGATCAADATKAPER